MPAIPLRKRPTPMSDDEEPDLDNDDDDTSTVASRSQQPSSTKRTRLSESRTLSSVGSPVLPNGYRNQSQTLEPDEPKPASTEPEPHQPGSIVRVRLRDFVTYSSAEFFPGPSLNMVIGPNGTGKSTLVCAICLGLGWGPQHLGRAKDVSEFVKHGHQEAMIEIELAARPGVHKKNPVIRRQIKREGNRSHFSIDGKQCTRQAVLDLAKSFSIQIDNLCQFLPQDKVCEFAALTPVELLYSTQRAAAPEYMVEWHDNLKLLRAEQKTRQSQYATDKETLTNLKGRQQMLQADVDRLKERASIKDRIGLLEDSKPFIKYRHARARHAEAKTKRRDAQAALAQLEAEVEPALRAVNDKQEYTAQVEKVVKERRRVVDRTLVATDNAMSKQEEVEDKIKYLRKEMEAERAGEKQRKSDVLRTERAIRDLEKLMQETPPEFNPVAYNERIREKTRCRQQFHERGIQLKETQESLVRQGKEKNARISDARKDLQSLDSQVGQQTAKLKQLSRDTAEAWGWIRNNQDQFEKPIFGPPVIECSIKDARYIDLVEACLQKNDFLALTVQTRNDFRKLGDQLYGTMKLAEITIRTTFGGLDTYRAPVDEEQMRRYGFDGWAMDYLNGPEPVLAMLCGECRLNQTGVALRDISDAQYDALTTSPISSWVTGRSSFQITRRREYGPQATSTRVRDIRKADIWISQPADMGAKRDLQHNIQGWTEEIKSFELQVQEAKEQLVEIRRQVLELEEQKRDIEAEKAAKQKAIAAIKALPTKLAREQEKLTTMQQAGAELKRRLLALEDKIDDQTVEKGRVALGYARTVKKVQELQQELMHGELVQLEARSDLEVLASRNTAVKDMLQGKRREVEEIARESQAIGDAARELLAECRVFVEEAPDERKQFLQDLPENQTLEDLETEIESEKARLELVHEGNPNAMKEFEDRQKNIEGLTSKVQTMEEKLQQMEAGIREIRGQWEPELDGLVSKISDAFSRSFEKIGCAGQVGVYKDEDFDQWAIQIQVKFREHEPLSLLDSHRQSGGERAVSTIFYLMSLQSLARAPFRVVDEINQGMDPRNERMVHERMVDIACREHTSQYFLITPKLLHGLKYHPRMRVLCIASGEYMPVGGEGLDFGRCLDQRRAMVEASA
ncbi:MAG: Structural maintenance of chromosomes protein 5 [Caeruleum heppii]|nr:MAG: Structural maintenance of chromosomes protein 5 [Caeruleum heppii]